MHILAHVGKLGPPGLAFGVQPAEARILQLSRPLLHGPVECKGYILVSTAPYLLFSWSSKRFHRYINRQDDNENNHSSFLLVRRLICHFL